VIVKTVILIVFLLILMNLAMALFFMVKDRGQSNRTARALTWRIGLSVAAFILLLVAYALGWIQPHGIVPPVPPTP
jgi:cytochrome bd-type quinol oxidase subunit 2